MEGIPLHELRKVTYLDTEHLEGRTVKLMPLWDGVDWRMWFNTPVGVIEGKIIDTTEGDYVAKTAAKQSDLFIPFVHVMWQRASWREICPLIIAIGDDFHNMGTSVAKLRHFFDFRKDIASGGANRFALTELEYLVTLTRTVFDLLQEMISYLWKEKVRLLDESSEAYRRGHSLPETFSTMVLDNKERVRTREEIEARFRLPGPLADEYAAIGPFFSRLRLARDRVVHGGGGFGHIFDTERGFCVSPKTFPFSSFSNWKPEHYYNQSIASVLPWLADTILQTIDACNRLANIFTSIIQVPPEMAPGYAIFIRGPHNEALVKLLEVHKGASAWWA